jgi:hypothetical protein
MPKVAGAKQGSPAEGHAGSKIDVATSPRGADKHGAWKLYSRLILDPALWKLLKSGQIIIMATHRYLLGPDLKAVTARRERGWLIRYLVAPDKMRARKDPIALELAQSNKVLMPNLGLTAIEVEELINYMEARSTEKSEVQLTRDK